MSSRRSDPVVIVAGVAAIVAGALLALERGGSVDLSPGWIGVIACTGLGAVFTVSGFLDRDE